MKAVLFDLDGTLLPMDEDKFVKGYFGYLYKFMAPFNFDKDEFVKAIWIGTDAMRKNDGKLTCEEAFWNAFSAMFPDKDKEALHKGFHDFYATEFKKAIQFCDAPHENAQKIIDSIKKKVDKIVLVANPVFPMVGMLTRIGFTGINPKSFDYISCYETSHYAKPNKMFIKEVLDKLNLKEDEVIYFGNSEKEDGKAARELGIKFYLTGNIVRDKDNLEPFDEVLFKDIEKLL